jgi:hypothetical protein
LVDQLNGVGLTRPDGRALDGADTLILCETCGRKVAADDLVVRVDNGTATYGCPNDGEPLAGVAVIGQPDIQLHGQVLTREDGQDVPWSIVSAWRRRGQ